MQGHGGDGQAGLLPQPAHLHQVDEALHVLLHLGQAAQAVQLGEQFLQGGLGLRRRGGFLRRPLVRLGRLLGGLLWGSGAAGDELVRLQGGAVSGQAVLSAQLQQNVGAGVDKAGLGLADHVVHRREQQEDEGRLVGKAPGQSGALPPVVVPQGLEEGGGLKQVVVGHAGGHLPVQGGGGEVFSRVDGVVELHMLGCDGLGVVRLPHPQGAVLEEGVRLPVEGLAQCGVGNPPPEGGDGLAVLLMDLGGGHGSWLHPGSSPLRRLAEACFHRPRC